MTDAQKYKKKKNILIISFMVLLLIFVGLICWIIIYAKNNPVEKFLSPDEIEIKQIQVSNYQLPTAKRYTTITDSNDFEVVENDENFELILNETGELKILRNDGEETIEIMQNDNNINNNIKLVYQTEKDSLILTETGELYKLIDNNVIDNQLKAGQILTNMTTKELVFAGPDADSLYVLNDKNKVINIDNLKEYNGVIKEIKVGTSTIYIYENGAFGLEEGKLFVDESNRIIEFNIGFDNKIIASNNIIYEINAVDNTLSTSSYGEFRRIGYKQNEDNSYKVTLISSTGRYDVNSSYYYSK